MIGMVIKICTHCNQDADRCKYQRQMRNFGLDAYADIFTREVVVPEWTSSNGSEK
jgi:hypothetical protein